jgi:hypothetical protein
MKFVYTDEDVAGLVITPPADEVDLDELLAEIERLELELLAMLEGRPFRLH